MVAEAGFLIACFCVLAALLWRRWRLGLQEAVVVLPAELRAARLVYAERKFRSTGAVTITARVDRVYRSADGVLVLVEMKTRRANRSYESDVIELSAQRVALMRQTGQVVAGHAYVLTQLPAGSWSGVHRVELMTTEEVKALVLRRESLLHSVNEARRTRVAGLCMTCPFSWECALPERGPCGPSH